MLSVRRVHDDVVNVLRNGALYTRRGNVGHHCSTKHTPARCSAVPAPHEPPGNPFLAATPQSTNRFVKLQARLLFLTSRQALSEQNLTHGSPDMPTSCLNLVEASPDRRGGPVGGGQQVHEDLTRDYAGGP